LKWLCTIVEKTVPSVVTVDCKAMFWVPTAPVVMAQTTAAAPGEREARRTRAIWGSGTTGTLSRKAAGVVSRGAVASTSAATAASARPKRCVHSRQVRACASTRSVSALLKSPKAYSSACSSR
jgi:hypothetical protein